MMDEHPNSFNECVKKDIYHRDIIEIRKCLERVEGEIGKKSQEMQKEINYKASNNQKLIIWVAGISLGISAYLFTMISDLTIKVNDHIAELWHDGANEVITKNSEHIVSLMCKVFGALC